MSLLISIIAFGDGVCIAALLVGTDNKDLGLQNSRDKNLENLEAGVGVEVVSNNSSLLHPRSLFARPNARSCEH